MTAAPQSCQPEAAPVRRHTPTPWQIGITLYPYRHFYGPADKDGFCPAIGSCVTALGEAHDVANAAFIVEAVNNHAPMVKTLRHCAELFETMARTMDRWATESREGGWSTHQVDDNRKRADDCRRYASSIRSALPLEQSGSGK